MYKVLKEDALLTYLLNANSKYLIKWLNLYFFMGRTFEDLVKILIVCRRVAPYTPTRSCVHIGMLKKKEQKKKIKKNKE
jgi:hypothetical protein